MNDKKKLFDFSQLEAFQNNETNNDINNSEYKKRLLSLDELEIGDTILYSNSIFRDMPYTLYLITDIPKYSIIDSEGRKHRMENREKVYPEDRDDTGNEIIKEYSFLGTGELTLNETHDLSKIELYKIDKNHPLYNSEHSTTSTMLGRFLKGFSS